MNHLNGHPELSGSEGKAHYPVDIKTNREVLRRTDV